MAYVRSGIQAACTVMTYSYCSCTADKEKDQYLPREVLVFFVKGRGLQARSRLCPVRPECVLCDLAGPVAAHERLQLQPPGARCLNEPGAGRIITGQSAFLRLPGHP